MKKALLVCMLLAVLASCKKTETETVEPTQEVAKDPTPSPSPPLVDADAPECLTPIVVDLGRFADATDRQEWLDDPENKYICSPNPDPELRICSEEKVYFDLAQVGEELDEVKTYKMRADWLHKNGHLICFPETYCYIEKSHALKRRTTMDNVDREPSAHRKVYKLSDIIGIITVAKYLSDDYDEYLVATGMQATLALGAYRDNQFNFSIPFLRSIIECNSIPGDPDFEFIYYDDVNPPAMVIKVTSGTKKWYYDYSQQPQKKLDKKQ